MIKCKECGKQVSTKAKTCPECGAPVKKQTGCLPGCLVLLVLVPLIVIGLSEFGNKKTSPIKTPSSPKLVQSTVQPNLATAIKKKSKIRLSLEQVFSADSIIKIEVNKIEKNKYWVLIDYHIKDGTSRSKVIKDAMSIIKLWSTDSKYKKIDRYALWGHDDNDEFSYMLSKFLLDASSARRIKWNKISQENFLDIVKKHGELFVHPNL